MHNVQKSSDFSSVAQLSDCVVAMPLYFQTLTFDLIPDHSCVCALSIFAFRELPKNSHVCLRRNLGMHSCTVVSSLQTTRNKPKRHHLWLFEREIISITVLRLHLLPFCYNSCRAQLYVSSKINNDVYWMNTHTHRVCATDS